MVRRLCDAWITFYVLAAAWAPVLLLARWQVSLEWQYPVWSVIVQVVLLANAYLVSARAGVRNSP